MNKLWNSFSDSFKYILILGFTTTVYNVLNDTFMFAAYEIDLVVWLTSSIAFIIFAHHDAIAKRAAGQKKVASGWWALLGVAYPIALSIVERKWTYALSYSAVTLGTILIFLGSFTTFGII